MTATDITFTVKASVANGRRLMRDDNGVTYWEPASEPVQSEAVEAAAPVPSPIIDYDPAKDLKVAPKRKRRKSEEGDK